MITAFKMSPEQWEEIRRGKFTASEFHRLMTEPKDKTQDLSVGAKSYVYEKAAEILTGRSKAIHAPALDWGTMNEANAHYEYQEASGNYDMEFFGNLDPCFLPIEDHAGASPDCLSPTILGEIKCPENSENHVKYSVLSSAEELKKLAPEYYWQTQMGMWAAKVELCHFITFDPRMLNPKHRVKWLEIKANEEDQERMAVKLFYAIELLKTILQRFQ